MLGLSACVHLHKHTKALYFDLCMYVYMNCNHKTSLCDNKQTLFVIAKGWFTII